MIGARANEEVSRGAGGKTAKHSWISWEGGTGMTGRGNSQDTHTTIHVTRSRRGFPVAVAIGTLLVTLLPGLGSPPGWAGGSAPLIWGRSGDVFTLDIPLSTDTQSTMVSTQLYNTLTRAKPGQVEIEPDLATSWSTTPDALVWTVKLRQGVTFHDGSAFNAEAAKFNIDRWADPKNPYRPKGGTIEAWDDFVADTYKESRVVAPETVQIVLKAPNAPLLSALSAISFGFASPQSIRQYGGDGVTQHPVGTGPFKFIEWARD